jgi:hypothetical protein
MMHPYFVATLMVGTVVVAYGAYIVFKEFSEEPILLHNTRGREGYRSEDEDSVIESEKNGLRKRRVKTEKSDRNVGLNVLIFNDIIDNNYSDLMRN